VSSALASVGADEGDHLLEQRVLAQFLHTLHLLAEVGVGGGNAVCAAMAQQVLV
jgi:hypothetical protein